MITKYKIINSLAGEIDAINSRISNLESLHSRLLSIESESMHIRSMFSASHPQNIDVRYIASKIDAEKLKLVDVLRKNRQTVVANTVPSDRLYRYNNIKSGESTVIVSDSFLRENPIKTKNWSRTAKVIFQSYKSEGEYIEAIYWVCFSKGPALYPLYIDDIEVAGKRLAVCINETK